MKHESGEGEMERYDMRTANTLSHACSCLYVTQGKSAKKMCVRHGVCTPGWLTIPCHGSEYFVVVSNPVLKEVSFQMVILATRFY